jgi:hypothetical protein
MPGTILGRMLVAISSSGPETMTRHPMKSSKDHAKCITPISMGKESQTI